GVEGGYVERRPLLADEDEVSGQGRTIGLDRSVQPLRRYAAAHSGQATASPPAPLQSVDQRAAPEDLPRQLGVALQVVGVNLREGEIRPDGAVRGENGNVVAQEPESVPTAQLELERRLADSPRAPE